MMYERCCNAYLIFYERITDSSEKEHADVKAKPKSSSEDILATIHQ